MRRRRRKPMTPRFDALEARQLLAVISVTSTGAHASDYPPVGIGCFGTSQSFTFTNSGSSTITVSFNVAGTAESGDYSFSDPTTGSTFTNNHGLSPDTITVPGISGGIGGTATLTISPLSYAGGGGDDSSVEASTATAIVNLIAPSGCCGPPAYTLGSSPSATITIDDADQASVSIQATSPGSDPRRIDDDSANQAVFTITRTGSTGLPLDLTLHASQDWNSNQDFYYGTGGPAFSDDIGSPQSAYNPGYNYNNFNVTMPAGAATMTVTVNAREAGDDAGTASEADSILTVTLQHDWTYGTHNNYLIGNATDSVSISDEPSRTVVCPDCPVPFVRLNPDLTGNGGAGGRSSTGLAYGTGTASVPVPSALASGGFGTYFGLGSAWTNQPGLDLAGSNGYGMVNADLPSLQQTDAIGAGSSGMLVTLSASASLFYNNVSGSYVPYDFYQVSLAAGGSGYVLSDTAGDVVQFYGFTGVPVAQQGQFASYTDPAGNVTTANYDVTSGKLTNLQRTDGTTTETYAYTYVASGPDVGQVQSTTLQRTVGGTTTPVRQESYTYYDGTQPYGNPGDLQLAQIKDGSGNVLDTSYYRYYTPADANIANGYVHGLKYVFNPASYARMVAVMAAASPATTPASADAQVAAYADQYFEYDANQRVSKELIQGAGCSCSGSTGQGAYTYAATTSANTPGPNAWADQDRRDPARRQHQHRLHQRRRRGDAQGLPRQRHDGTPAITRHWATYNRYDTAGRLILTAQPSAVLGYSDTYADLTNGLSTTYLGGLRGRDQPDRLRHHHHRHVHDSRRRRRLPQGPQGPEWHGRHADPDGLDAVLQPHLRRRPDDLPGGDRHVLPQHRRHRRRDDQLRLHLVLAAPTRSSRRPSAPGRLRRPRTAPAPPTSPPTFYDAYGRPIWTKDGDGFINYTAYDNATGAVVKSIADVDTTRPASSPACRRAGRPPPAAALNLITTVRRSTPGPHDQGDRPDGQRHLHRLRRRRPRGPHLPRLERHHRHRRPARPR